MDEYGGIFVDAEIAGLSTSFSEALLSLLMYDLVTFPLQRESNGTFNVIGPIRGRSELTSHWVTDLHLKFHSKYDKLLNDLEDHHKKKTLEYPLKTNDLGADIIDPWIHKMVMENRLILKSFKGTRKKF